MKIQANASGTRSIEVSEQHLTTIDRYQLLRDLIDSNGYVDEAVVDKLRLNVRSLLEGEAGKDKSLLDRPIGLNDDSSSRLPANLGEAVERFASSELMKETLGDHIHSYLVKTKQTEWMDYLRHVSSWELDRYLGVL